MAYLPDYSSLIEMIVSPLYLYLQTIPVKDRFAAFKNRYSNMFGDNEGILLDIIQVRLLYGRQLETHNYGQIENIRFYTDAEKQELRDVFSNKPAYAQALIAKNDKMLTMPAKTKDYVAHETPNVPQDKVFDAIIANFKGNVVVVDFWATWCGPCMFAMNTMKPLKNEMIGRDVVFLYLTNETSPLATWELTYPTISGEHYRVNSTQWNYWARAFNIIGIPTYMIFDRQGELIMRYYAGFPGNDIMRQDIERGLLRL